LYSPQSLTSLLSTLYCKSLSMLILGVDSKSLMVESADEKSLWPRLSSYHS
jgi:hypothetical protein